MRRIEELRRRMGKPGEAAPKTDRAEPEVRERTKILIQGPDGKLIEGSPEEILRQLDELAPDVEELKKLLERLRGSLPEPKKSPK